MTENTIIDLPTGVVTFHIDNNEPRIPAIAVASGAHIYIYKVTNTFLLCVLEVHRKWGIVTSLSARE